LISPAQHGNAMVEQFFEEHRDLRLFDIRLKDKGQEYLNSHKTEIISILSDIDLKIRGNLMSRSTGDQG
jgi:hypothetical protein